MTCIATVTFVHYFSPFGKRKPYRGHGELYFAWGVLWLPTASTVRLAGAGWRLGSRWDRRPPHWLGGFEVQMPAGLGGWGGRIERARLPFQADARASSCFCCRRFLLRWLLKDAIRGAQQNALARKSLGARAWLVKVGVNCLLRSRHGDPSRPFFTVTNPLFAHWSPPHLNMDRY